MIVEKVIELIEREIGQKVTADTRLDQLDCDSLEYLDLMLAAERELGIPAERSAAFQTIGDFSE